MADQLATAAELARLPGMAGVDTDTADLLLQMATGVVQGVVRQRLVAVTADQITLLGTADADLWLPERPVVAVTAVTVDGVAVTDWRLFGPRLRRACGWSDYPPVPAEVSVTYDHGYDPEDYRLGLAKAHVLMLAAGAAHDAGVVSEGIDDYQVTYERMASRMESSEVLSALLRRHYGPRAGLVKLG